MFLSDVTIEEFINQGKIKVFPDFDPKNIRLAGVRLHLGNKLLIPTPNQAADLSKPADLDYKEHFLKISSYTLAPGDFVLGASYEIIQTARNILTIVDGRSTVARLGLTVHVSNCIMDGNHDEPRAIVFSIKNIGNFNVTLNHKDAFAMASFVMLSQEIKKASQSQYRNQQEALAPNLHFRPGIDV